VSPFPIHSAIKNDNIAKSQNLANKILMQTSKSSMLSVLLVLKLCLDKQLN
jgi:hypothetical protein